ncbi:MAG: DUF2339 domain-containing protein, partial [Candidatus Rokubacteria bacterium]|nr:DUF2339 domain-containing protein [Candidatus Rokubacteria bacterium]
LDAAARGGEVRPTAAPAPTPEPAAPAPWAVEPAAPAPVAPPAPEPVAAAPAAAGRAGLGELEGRVGARWLNRAGALILVVGIGFFLKYAFDNAWIGPAGRVASGLLFGVVLLVVGDRVHRAAYRAPAQGLVAAGIATLYLSGYAAYAFYHLVPQPAAFAFLVLVTATGIAVAIHHDARAIALLASLGGFLTPVILSTGRDAAVALFTYLAILDAGILASAYWRRWTELPVVSFLATQGLYAAWFETWYRPEKLPVALGGATVFFAIFALVPPLGAAGGRRGAGGSGLARAAASGLVLAVPLAYVVAARAILHPDYTPWLALLCLGLALVYALLGRWALDAAPGTPALALLHGAVALGFLTLTFAVQFGPHLTTIAWSVEGVAVLWGAFRLGSRRLRLGALAVLALAGGRWLMLVTNQPGSTGTFLVGSPLFVPTLAFAAACALGAFLYDREAPETAGWEAGARPLLVLAAVGSLALFVTTELTEFPPLRFVRGYVAVLRTLVWTAAAVPLLALARGDRTRILLGAATGLLAILGLGAASVDVEAWRRLGPEFRTPVLNLRFLSGLALVALYAWYAWMAPLWPFRAEATALRLRRLAAAAAALFLLWHASAEVGLLPLTGLPRGEAAKLRNMGLSILWTLYAFAAMAVGMRRHVAAFRIGAIALFGLTVAKVFLVDLSELDAIYRILSFLVLGAVLLAASFLYARYRARLGAA